MSKLTLGLTRKSQADVPKVGFQQVNSKEITFDGLPSIRGKAVGNSTPRGTDMSPKIIHDKHVDKKDDKLEKKTAPLPVKVCIANADTHKVTVTLPGKQLEYSSSVKVEQIITDGGLEKDRKSIGAMVNNKLCGLDETIDINVSKFEPVLLNSPNGSEIYRNSLSFLLSMAVANVFTDRRLVIGHSLGNGLYYELLEQSGNPIEQEDLDRIKEEMNRLVKLNLPIHKRKISWQEAVDHFTSVKQEQTQMLVSQHNTFAVPIVKCEGYIDLQHSVLVNNTSHLSIFELMKYGRDSGFILRFPHQNAPNHIPAFIDLPTVFEVFSESKQWGNILGVQCVGDLNRIIYRAHKGDLQKFILVCEALHEKKMADIASRAMGREGSKLSGHSDDEKRLILIAGPTSAGKTTFARKLCIQLQVLGKLPICISCDNFFVNRELTPKDENGNYDFEKIEALDVPFFNKVMQDLLKGEEVQMPSFNFKIGQRYFKPGNTLQLGPKGVLVVEGIHALNDKLASIIDSSQKYKIFISTFTQLNLDDHNRLPTTDNRLIRRMVRDFQFRGWTAENTIQMWPSVRNGEELYIFPHQGKADVVFNSTLDYEISALKSIAEPLLVSVSPTSEHYSEALRLLDFLHHFDPILEKYVPQQSILREFIGGSPYNEDS